MNFDDDDDDDDDRCPFYLNDGPMSLPPESRAHLNGILTHTLQKCFLGRELVCFNFRVGIATA